MSDTMTFHPAVAADEVEEGGVKRVLIGDRKIGVYRLDGVYYALDDTCTHIGCSLTRGELEGPTVTCACHGSQFDVTSGAVLRGPAQQPVRSRQVQIDGDARMTES